MSRARYNLYEAKTSLSELVERAAQGEEIIIAKGGKPLAKLISARRVHRRKPGGWRKGLFISDDFDDPLPARLRAAFDGKTR
jgi:prevent-host-death family protein